MKYFITGIFLCHVLNTSLAQNPSKQVDTTLMQPIEINTVRALNKTPVAKTNLTKEDIEKNNIGQDLPFILNQTASVVVNSDAGNGIGYTGIRIRGTDAARINVSLNGIPYNDAESQGTFFVDLPDIASSAGSIQVQRGVGTSANGAGAFGGAINISTNDLTVKKSLQFCSDAGSYHSFRNSLLLNSGLLAGHFTIDARLSDVRSNGYIDRATSRLRSFYTSAAYTDTKNSLRINIFSGKEKTYQAWYGIDQLTLEQNRKYNPAGTEKPGEPYDNETDNYIQTHYQLFYNRKINTHWKANIAFFFTKGKGYYEEYKAGQSLSDYGLPLYINGNDTIAQTDLIRRLWLDNNFYGGVFSAQYQQNKTALIICGGFNRYDGNHFGEISHAIVQAAVPVNYQWYNLDADKEDGSIYVKWTQQLSKHWQSFLDLQERSVGYNLYGFEDNPSITVKKNYFFFNPKIGLTYSKNKITFYISYGRAAKEPNRDDFETGKTQQPSPEKLNDFEAGFEYKNNNYSWSVNSYYMNYKDQLILTGKVNEVGAYTRTNVDDSYRTGVELQGAIKLCKLIAVNGNLTLSENRITNFTEYLDDYDNGGQQLNFHKKTTIAYSPSVISSASVNVFPIKNAELNLMSKYVSRQYLDNTSMKFRSLASYFIEDIRLNYTCQLKNAASFKLFIQGNNILSKKYVPNGYSYSYIENAAVTTENYYLPMAPFNITAGLVIKL